jgi:uncharacterized membrane protein YdjX (TVP38/TMEM64 family)
MNPKIRSLLTFLILVVGLVLFLQSGLNDRVSVAKIRELGENPAAPLLIIAAMAVAWTYAFPASVFFFLTPLLFPPLEATVIICAGTAAGTVLGYVSARSLGGPWVERFRDRKITQFLEKHSSFASLFAVRIFPGSQHGLINYSAGILKIPLGRFLTATLSAVAIKAFLYAKAIDGSVGTSNLREALNWETVSVLSMLGLLALAGHIWQRRTAAEMPETTA